MLSIHEPGTTTTTAAVNANQQQCQYCRTSICKKTPQQCVPSYVFVPVEHFLFGHDSPRQQRHGITDVVHRQIVSEFFSRGRHHRTDGGVHGRSILVVVLFVVVVVHPFAVVLPFPRHRRVAFEQDRKVHGTVIKMVAAAVFQHGEQADEGFAPLVDPLREKGRQHFAGLNLSVAALSPGQQPFHAQHWTRQRTGGVDVVRHVPMQLAFQMGQQRAPTGPTGGGVGGATGGAVFSFAAFLFGRGRGRAMHERMGVGTAAVLPSAHSGFSLQVGGTGLFFFLLLFLGVAGNVAKGEGQPFGLAAFVKGVQPSKGPRGGD